MYFWLIEEFLRFWWWWVRCVSIFIFDWNFFWLKWFRFFGYIFKFFIKLLVIEYLWNRKDLVLGFRVFMNRMFKFFLFWRWWINLLILILKVSDFKDWKIICKIMVKIRFFWNLIENKWFLYVNWYVLVFFIFSLIIFSSYYINFVYFVYLNENYF